MQPALPPDTTEGTGLVQARGRRWAVLGRTHGIDCDAVRLQQLGRDYQQTLLTPFDRLRPLLRTREPRTVGRRRWLHELDRALAGLHPFGGLQATSTAPIRMLAYQLEPAMAVLRHGTARLLIADAVGLGKTIQAGLVLRELLTRHDSFRALVLAPAGLRDQWIQELRLRLDLSATLADANWLRSPRGGRPAHVNPWSLPGIYVASHDLVKRAEVLRPLEDVCWDVVVVDEAHVATSGTHRRAAIHAIATRARHVLLLTATPHNGNVTELESLCGIGAVPDDVKGIAVFARTRAEVRTRAEAPDEAERKTVVFSVACSEAERRMHDLLERYSSRVWAEARARGDDRARLVAIVLRKRALSSAASLAASLDRRLALLGSTPGNAPWQMPLPLARIVDEDPLEDEEPVAALAVPGLSDTRAERRWLTLVADAAHVAANDERKTRFLLRLLGRVRRRAGSPRGESAIVFTEYRDTLKRLAHRLSAAGHDVVLLHGGQTAIERTRVQAAFNAGGGVLLATDAASEGLNLHHCCRLVVHYELPWNPARLEQRAGRVDRFGQPRRVHEVALVAAHTAERMVIAPLVARGRAAALRPSLLATALTESSVAAAVLDRQIDVPVRPPTPPALPPSLVEPPAGLAALAVQEALRLESRRSVTVRSGLPRTDPGRPSVSAIDSTNPTLSGLLLIMTVEIVDDEGTTLHAEPLALRIGELEVVSRLPARRLREIVAELSERGSPLHAVSVRECNVLSEDVIRLEGERRARTHQRLTAMRAALERDPASAAQKLLQPGLFDRRAWRAGMERIKAASCLQLDSFDANARHRSFDSVSLRVELVAALHVRRR